MTAPLLVAEGIFKRFATGGTRSLLATVRRRERPPDMWALREVDATVGPGEVLAIVGRNGAGKSTMLKVCAGVTRPTYGTLKRPPRVAPLIEVGAGFHPELTGRENVFVNGRLLGIGQRELEARFSEIVEFAELTDAIDRPVRQYSSGMFMRLGFSVAIHTRPQLLIVDEVLAVGDLPFQLRCLDKIRELREQGTGVLFVSHNLAAVLSLADRAMLLEGGRATLTGDPRDVVGAYHDSLAVTQSAARDVGEDGAFAGEVELEQVTVLDAAGQPRSLWSPGERATLVLQVRAHADVPESALGIRLIKEGAGMIGTFLGTDGPYVAPLRRGETAQVRVDLDLNVGEGSYLVDIGMGLKDISRVWFDQKGVARFGVAARPGASGIVDFAPVVRP
ncbi:MAG: ABC transporter ATP-binding protein [Mycobacteriales bacterium]|nr:ABC transporter ATP-binding protein [Mycobacteriales bacterium]